MPQIVIVGASLAGVRTAESLRSAGFDGSIRMLGDETVTPYDRPPLSKQLLAGSWPQERVLLRPADDYAGKLEVDLRLGVRAAALDLAGRAVVTDAGERIGFDGLVIATGTRARRLPGTEGVPTVHVVRTLDDSLRLRAALLGGSDRADGRRVVVIGAGFIGAEVAATARSMGVAVSILEAAPLPMQRVLPGAIGGFVADVLDDHDVDVRLGVTVDRLEGGARVERVVLADGATIDADVVVAGIGVVPSTGWLEGSGLTLGNGVVCDATCLAAPGVVAAGDLAEWPNPLYGETMRIEQWDNAIEQGAYAGRRLLLGDSDDHPVAPYAPVPWFWSDLFDRKLQLAGRVAPTDHVEIVDGSLEERRFVALFRRDDRCVAVLGVNRPRFVVQLRMQMAEPLAWSDALAVFGR